MDDVFVIVETMALLQHRVGLQAARDFHEEVLPVLNVRWVDEELYRRGADRLWREDRRQLSQEQAQESQRSEFEQRLHLMRVELERTRSEQDAARETEWRLRHIRRADPQRRVHARGDLVALTPAEDGTRPPNATVLAVPGDHVRVSRAGIIVNGTPITGVSAAFLAGLPDDAWEQVIPADYYFVAAEQQDALHAIRFWGLVPAARIAGIPSN